ncbi:hypothetical protein KP79_PYT09440 [Mizuhopecten yessoensis]|uniref:Uncharacterized protein n=1 Tax=Mizuhopecten yessoensis TaxID=6573 RepID=A0A210QNT7_MIZYE|nr:hypothetical protein KP79_PYT09440 [Mizuhopecten yessoensis]
MRISATCIGTGHSHLSSGLNGFHNRYWGSPLTITHRAAWSVVTLHNNRLRRGYWKWTMEIGVKSPNRSTGPWLFEYTGLVDLEQYLE